MNNTKMTDQLHFKEYLPDIIVCLYTAILFGLMALPHSQYALLNEMNDLSSSETVNWTYALPGMFTLFEIMVMVATVLLGICGALSNRLYNYRFIMVLVSVFATLQTILEILYFSFAVGKTFEDGTPLIEAWNIVCFVIHILGYVAFLVTFILFVDKPYRKIREEMKNTPVEEAPQRVVEETPVEEEPKKEEKVEEKKPESTQDKTINDKMEQMILEEVASGKISPDEAAEMLKKLK